jgi:signal transduction histidine kinase
MQFSLYAGLLLVSSLISVALAGYSLHRPSDTVMRSFLYLMLGVFSWSFTYFLEAISTSIGFKVFWSVVSVIDLIVPVLFLCFVLQFTRNGDRIPEKAIYLLLIIPVISIFLSATFPMHGLIWPRIYLTDTVLAGISLIYVHGAWYWVEVIYSLMLYFTAAGVLLYSVTRSAPVYAIQLWMVFVSSLFPFISTLLYAFAAPVFRGIDFTPISFTLTSLVLIYAITRYQLFDLIPIAHEQIITDMQEGVIVIDEQNRIVEINPAAQRLLAVTLSMVGRHISALSPLFPGCLDDLTNCSGMKNRISLIGDRWIDFRISPVNRKMIPAKGSGMLLLCIDVTDRELSKLEVSKRNAELELMNHQLSHEVSERRAAETSLRLANKKLNLLTSITRHDVLNWVTVVNGYARIIQESGGEPDTESLDKIVHAGETIGEIISFTSVYEDMGTEAPGWIRIESVFNEPDITHLKKEVIFSLNVTGLMIYADLMFSRVFYNLLDNSLRHGNGVTRVCVSGYSVGEEYCLVYEDNGDGIPDGEKEIVFRQGYGKNSGLGLFLIREILDITGIRIRECGVYGEGVRFEMMIPNGNFRL